MTHSQIHTGYICVDHRGGTHCCARRTAPQATRLTEYLSQNVRNDEGVPIKGPLAGIAKSLRRYALLGRAGGDNAKGGVGLDVPQFSGPDCLLLRLQHHRCVLGLLDDALHVRVLRRGPAEEIRDADDVLAERVCRRTGLLTQLSYKRTVGLTPPASVADCILSQSIKTQELRCEGSLVNRHTTTGEYEGCLSTPETRAIIQTGERTYRARIDSDGFPPTTLRTTALLGFQTGYTWLCVPRMTMTALMASSAGPRAPRGV